MTLTQDLNRYQNALLAGHLVQGGKRDSPFVKPALDKLLGDLGDDAQRAASIAIERGGAEQIIQTYSEKFDEVLNAGRMDSLYTHYSDVLTSYLSADDTKKAEAEFMKFRGTTYQNIQDDLTKADTILKKGSKYEYPQKEIDWAKATTKKFAKITMLMETLKIDYIEKLRSTSVSSAMKSDLEQIVNLNEGDE